MTIKHSAGLARLRRDARQPFAPYPLPLEGSLPLEAVDKLEVVFQPRDLRGLLIEREWFIEDLVRAIERNGNRGLDPILVWWTGSRWVVLDGHHRIAAYLKAGWSGRSIPVEVFNGGIDDARLEATRRNTKNTLPMRQPERLQAAWRLVCTSALSKGQIANGTGVATRTVSSMRRRMRELLLAAPHRWTQQALGDEQWAHARTAQILSQDMVTEDPDDANRRTANVWAARLTRHFGPKLTKNPEAFALAVAYVSEALPKRLIETEAWASYRDTPADESELADYQL